MLWDLMWCLRIKTSNVDIILSLPSISDVEQLNLLIWLVYILTS